MYKKEYSRQWYLKNKQRLLERRKQRYQRQKEQIHQYYLSIRSQKLAYQKLHRQQHPEIYKQRTLKRIDKKHAYDKKYDAEHKKEKNEYQKTRRKQNINHRIKFNLRCRLNTALKNNFKSGSAVKNLGCSITEFKSWLEKQFNSEMTWNNYGSYWEIDHIIPLSSFDLTDKRQLIKACHWFNLRPLTVGENRSKHDKLEITKL